jgi:hypothetical protein
MILKISDEDPGCLFRIPNPNFCIPDPQQRIQVRIFFKPKKFDLGCPNPNNIRGFFSYLQNVEETGFQDGNQIRALPEIPSFVLQKKDTS